MGGRIFHVRAGDLCVVRNVPGSGLMTDWSGYTQLCWEDFLVVGFQGQVGVNRFPVVRALLASGRFALFSLRAVQYNARIHTINVVRARSGGKR